VHSAAFVAYLTHATDAAGSVATGAAWQTARLDGHSPDRAWRAPPDTVARRPRPRRLAVRRARACEAC
jgi:hypothetical protein